MSARNTVPDKYPAPINKQQFQLHNSSTRVLHSTTDKTGSDGQISKSLASLRLASGQMRVGGHSSRKKLMDRAAASSG